MKIKLKRDDLLFQLDKQSRGEKLPEVVILDGLTVSDEELRDELEKAYPAAKKLFRPIAYLMFRELWYVRGQQVPTHALFSVLDSNRPRSIQNGGMANSVAVHVEWIRKILIRHSDQLPFRIRTVRSYQGVTGGYILEKL
jgi:hypothetical protein